MKLVLVTAVEDFHKEVIKLFKKAQIKNFSQSDIHCRNGSLKLVRI